MRSKIDYTDIIYNRFYWLMTNKSEYVWYEKAYDRLCEEIVNSVDLY